MPYWMPDCGACQEPILRSDRAVIMDRFTCYFGPNAKEQYRTAHLTEEAAGITGSVVHYNCMDLLKRKRHRADELAQVIREKLREAL